jgi:hypothetical protein
MKARIFAVSLAILLAAGSLSLAGDQKPFKGWVQAIGDPDYSVDPLEYPYLAGIIQQRGAPLIPAQIQLFQGINNVGGASIHENAQIFYFNPASLTIDFFEASTITVANGDQIFLTVAGIVDLIAGTWAATDTVIGGTGRFEGANGSIQVTPDFNSHGQDIIVFNGRIMTVGRAKK